MFRGPIFLIGVLILAPFWLFAQTSLTLPVASTVQLESDVTITEGSVIRYDEVEDRYLLSEGVSDSLVYGVVAERPAVVFVTEATAVPVVTEGVTEVLVVMDGGPIQRGDVLTTAAASGYAMRATEDGQAVFAVALEAATTDGVVLASIGAEQAQAVWTARQAAISAEGGIIVSAARGAIATLMVLGAIGFLLYSFRSIMTTGVISIGRNPRARQSVLLVSIGSMVLAIVLTGLVVFVAIGILILPV